MSLIDVAAALERVRAVLRRRPESGLHDDAAATARWEGGTRVLASHAGGARFVTDMPTELGGSGEHPTPGWLFRAGMSSCAVVSIVFAAAGEGIELAALEVKATSRSDSRGMFGLPDAEGRPISAGPGELQLHVRIAAPGVPEARLRALVEAAVARSPMPTAVRNANPLALNIDVSPG
ncbi:OsmC family protein [Pelomonas sp. KK5]|uniref:OsmC family protein n=1 Tax=Pelomonas sp. KK5 TaxID=1855730 RepID=UPI00097BF5BD|nr:OsmC family protein [Pelomonas sp. KK5]